ncbi:MAG: glycosyltransferase family 87 protein [Parvibaculaceae bacterium]
MSSRSGLPLFDPERLRVYPRIAVVLYVLAAVVLVVTASAMIDVFGKPLGSDFITFWAASKLTLQGSALAAFDPQQIFAAEKLAVPANELVFLWSYPPSYQLVVAPLAWLPYFVAFALFVGLGLALYVASLRPLFDEMFVQGRDQIFLVLAFPAVFICAMHGQNAFYSAAIFAGGLILSERGRPWSAGFVLGFLICKPQLGVLLPLAFICAGQWRLLVATGLSALAICVAATLVFGVELWVAFFANAALVREVMEQGLLPLSKMPSAFAFVRELGGSVTFAYGAQGLSALTAAVATAFVWWQRGADRLSFAVLIAATLLVPPYSFDYEFTILAPVLVILGSDMALRGAVRWEKVALVVFFVWPVVVAPLAEDTHIQSGFLLFVAVLVFAVRRALVTEDTLMKEDLAASLPTHGAI